jgi:NADH:ubiquinone oxidoreductase subunit 4 (subunit M)
MKILLILPIIGSLIIAVLPTETIAERVKVKQIALITSILTLIEGIRV